MTDIAAQFPDKNAKPAEWLDWCCQRLTGYAEEIDINPMTNSVQRLSHDLAVALEQGQTTLSMVNTLMEELASEALIERADRFRDAHQTKGDNVPGVYVQEQFGDDEFAKLKSAIETTRGGIVFTGHPTFAISRRLRDDFVDYVESDEGDQRKKAADALRRNRHRPDDDITIFSEHEDVKKAISNAAVALDTINQGLLVQAEKKFPNEWHTLSPTPLSVATWVGYDLDGRTDIHWGQTLTIRLNEKAEQLEAYARQLREISGLEESTEATSLADDLARAATLTANQASLFADDLDDPDVVVRAANALSENHPDRLISLSSIIKRVTKLIDVHPTRQIRLELCLLRARMKAMGLGLARIHLRVNAAQVRSTLRHDFGVQSDADFMGRSALEIAAKQAKIAESHQINFTSVFLEQMTARRQFMLCAQILKHIDADTPIRFLIAECEAPATVMGAVYLARAYGVANKLDISPLFETPEALERGGRFLERLLQEEEYRHYVQERGRISIQLGFSDSGRFMGQIAADLAIERLHILLARALSSANLTSIEALIFNTNGESMGRGGYPSTIEDRLHHLITPWTRARYSHDKIALNVESAFQGGEGFLHFQTPTMAIKAISEIFRVSFQEWQRDEKDMYYRDINFSWDYYRGVKSWQEALFDNPDYTRAISSFGQKFLFTTGSRKVRRQRKGAADMSPRALRAIPHNAILQQMAIPANVACGTGTTIRQEADRFIDFVKNSDRMRRLMRMAERARNMTSLPAFLGYANIYNASYWTRRATATSDTGCAECYLTIAKQLEDQVVFTALGRLGNKFAVDLSSFDIILNGIYGADRTPARHEGRLHLHVLHALRQSVIMHALILLTRLPGFSGRHEVTHSDLMDMILHLQIDDVIQLLDEIFPVSRPEIDAMAGVLEETSLDLHEQGGYPDVHSDVVAPLKEIQKIILETGVAISHFYGAYG